MTLGKKILDLRKKKGLSQEELGERVDVTRQTISNWELDITQPNVEQLKLLSKEFNISIDELLDNDIQNVLVKKVSNTEELAGLILKFIKVISIIMGIIVIGFICLILFNIIFKTIKHSKDTGRDLEETIHCKIYGEEHSYSLTYEELTGNIIAGGGDSYFSDILDLNKYDDAHQVFNVINDYVKKNGGSCNIINDYDLNDIVDFHIKKDTLTNKGATFIIETKSDYKIGIGQPFTIEKYDSETHDFQVFNSTTDKECSFNMIGYILEKNKPFEIKQSWSCMYNELPKGYYRIVKHVNFESDIPVDENNSFYIWTEFEIE